MDEEQKRKEEEYFDDYTAKRQLYTFVYLPVLHKYRLTFHEYAVIDSIATLARNPDYEFWCKASKRTIAGVLRISERTVFRAMAKGIEKKLLEYPDDKTEKEDPRIRPTKLWWIDTEFSAEKKGKSHEKITSRYDEESEGYDSKSEVPMTKSQASSDKMSDNTLINSLNSNLTYTLAGKKISFSESVKYILEIWSSLTGRTYKSSSKTYQDLIKTTYNKGAGPEDILRVVVWFWLKWKDKTNDDGEDKGNWVRPRTILNSKFDDRLAEANQNRNKVADFVLRRKYANWNAGRIKRIKAEYELYEQQMAEKHEEPMLFNKYEAELVMNNNPSAFKTFHQWVSEWKALGPGRSIWI